MSDIPKSEQSWSPLETQHLCYKLRRRINSELLFSFGYSGKHLIKYIAKLTESIKDRKERNKRMHDLYEQMSAYSHWLIEAERDDVASLTRDIARHLRKANTIWPTYYSEYCERRVELDRAREACNALEDELQYLAESLPADKNRYTSIVLDVEEIFNKIGALRSADNRFLDTLPDVPPAVMARREKEKQRNKKK